MNEENTKQENERQYESINQLLSMHSSLRDKYKSRAFWLNTAQIGISLVLCVFAFVGDDVLSLLGYHPPMARFVLGFSAVIALLLSITEFRVDWTAMGAVNQSLLLSITEFRVDWTRHVEAVESLGELKAKYRKTYNESEGTDLKKNSRLTNQYNTTMANLPPIPERYFIQLKVDHQYKRILSRRLSQNPKAPKWFLRIQLRLEGMRGRVKKGGE